MHSRFVQLAAVLALVGCSSVPQAPRDPSRYKYKVPFERGPSEETENDRIDVTELWGTRRKIEVGGEYLVVGRYELQSAESARVYFYLTADNWDNSGPNLAHQWTTVARGNGTFVLQHEMAGPGRFHVNLRGDGRDLADLYLAESEAFFSE